MKLSRRSGITLLEVLAALVVVAVALPIIMQGISLCVRAARSSASHFEASNLAASKIEELTAMTARGQSGPLTGDFGTIWPDYRWTASFVLRDYSLEELTVIITKANANSEALPVARMSTLVYQGAQ